jgi:hypothetical protein
MISSTLRDLSTPLLRSQLALWIAFLLTPIGPVVIAAVLTSSRPEQVSSLEIPLTGLGMLFAVAAYARFRQLHSDDRIRDYLQREIPTEVLARPHPPGVIHAEAAEKLRALPESELRLYRMLHHYQKDLILAFALAEAVLMVGVVHCMLTARFPVLFPYVLVSAALQVAGRPRGALLQQRAESLHYLG